MKVLILAGTGHEKAKAYGEHRRELGDEVMFSQKGDVTVEVDEVVIPAETKDLQEIAAAYKSNGKIVTTLGADGPAKKEKEKAK
jgi:hypothetical protein